MKGTKVGSYIIDHQIGEGGMGVVYAVKHDRMNRTAVVKMLHKQLAGSPEMAKRFENEATAAASIGHPGIVQVFDIGQHTDGALYIVMEHLRGESMQDRLSRQGRLTVAQSIAFIRQAAGALGAAHKLGIVHRDLKPDNIFIVPDPEVEGGERVKLLDFGIAKLSVDGAAGMQTKTGAMMGTPHYMSPEQCQGAGGVDSRSDLYSLGCILFQLVTGRTPFVGNGAGDFIVAHMTQAPPTLRSMAPYAPSALEGVVATLLAKNPAHRFESCEALVNALGQIPQTEAGAAGHVPTAPISGAAPPSGFATAPTAAPGSLPSAPGSQPSAAPSSLPPPATTLGLSAGESARNIAAGAPQSTVHQPKRSSGTKWAVLASLALVCVAGVSYGLVTRNAPTTPAKAELASAGEMSGMSSPEELTPAAASGEALAPAGQPGAEALDAAPLAIEPAKAPQSKKGTKRDSKKKAKKGSLAKTVAGATKEAVGAAKEASDAAKLAVEGLPLQPEATVTPPAKEVAPTTTPRPNQSRIHFDHQSIKKQMKSTVGPLAQKCAEKFSVRRRKIVADVTFARTGRVKTVKLDSPSFGAMGRCLNTAARTLKLLPRARPHTFKVPFLLN